jgi:hypothetical protein
MVAESTCIWFKSELISGNASDLCSSVSLFHALHSSTRLVIPGGKTPDAKSKLPARVWFAALLLSSVKHIKALCACCMCSCN